MAARSAMGQLIAVRSSCAAVAPKIAKPSLLLRCVSSSPDRAAQESPSETSVASTSTSNTPSAISLPSPFEPALFHPRTHNHHVASLHFRAHGPGQTLQNLQFYCDFALRAGYALGIPLSGTVSLPTRTSLWTVPKGPFVHKKSQENFQRRVHKRLIKVWDADIEVVDRWLHFLRINCMEGVGMRAEIYRYFPLSIGSTLLAASTSQLRSLPEGSAEGDDATLRASEADSDQVARLARAIIEEEVAKQDAEDEAENFQQLSQGPAESKRGSEEATKEVSANEAATEEGKTEEQDKSTQDTEEANEQVREETNAEEAAEEKKN
ncbi:hypothetical protein CBS101457_001201 [Exobasidium rhododendri]|nr:hypothetical protein CBS101457_001201 [Exobasidium rhododendri]